MKNLFSLLLVLFAMKSFALEKNVKITIKAIGHTNDEVLITSSTMFFSNNTLAKTTLDADGKAVVGIQLSQPVFIGIKIGNTTGMGYLTL